MDCSVSLQSLIETHDQPFIVMNTQMTVVAVNHAYERRFGRQRDDLVGKPCYEVIQCQDEPCWDSGHTCPHKQVLDNMQPYAGIFSHCRDERQSYQVQVKGFPITDADGGLYIGEVLTPIFNASEEEQETPQMLGQSARFVKLMQQLQKAAVSDIPIMIEGETGTGKELAAAFVHAHSRRKDKALVTVDCTVLAEDLFESELFGHEKGSFTGSTGSKAGLFELADGGTLFLDEIGEMPLQLQVKLLRALETGQFRRVGGTKTLSSNVRIVCATNQSLKHMVAAGQFRKDLYYRIAVFPVQMPPLRERLEDIPIIATSLLKRIEPSMGKTSRLSKEALVKLLQYDYPGNIRELRNVLQLAAALSPNGVIGPEEIQVGNHHVEEESLDDIIDSAPHESDEGDDVVDLKPMEAMEAAYVRELLVRFNGRRGAVAEEMGISERTLYRKLKRYGINT